MKHYKICLPDLIDADGDFLPLDSSSSPFIVGKDKPCSCKHKDMC